MSSDLPQSAPPVLEKQSRTSPYSVFLDLESASTKPDALIFSFAAIAVKSGEEKPESVIDLRPCIISQINAGRHICPKTMAFHRERGTLPNPEDTRIPLGAFAAEITGFFRAFNPHRVWIQGPDFDTPILFPFFTRVTLESLLAAIGCKLPWDYWRTMDARTTWNLAFPDEKHPPRPHTAIEDCHATHDDTRRALATLNRIEAL